MKELHKGIYHCSGSPVTVVEGYNLWERENLEKDRVAKAECDFRDRALGARICLVDSFSVCSVR